TWAYYLVVRHLALFGEAPFRSVLINGMVLGRDGRKMSKSLGNFVATPEVFNMYGADAARQWAAAGGSTGFDVPFRWSDVEYGVRFMRKLWNACRFVSIQLEDYDPNIKAEPELLDRWMLSRLERVVKAVTDWLEECQFMNALETVRNFVWHVFCDHYLEAVKYRLYGGGEERRAAQAALHYAVKRILQLLAPVIPYITEEIYSYMYSAGEGDSIHLTPWPKFNEALIDPEAEEKGELIISVIRDLRREKNRRGIPLNRPITYVALYAEGEEGLEALKSGMKDIKETVKVERLEVIRGSGGDVEVDGYPGIRFSI
ncbi:class I tRNA ligase family protein, partial [Candidatus Bathyarchaeota archaeon]|nr:class I tRNA ligase family protein [Candidatus Bathyarchaeota archaeon]